MITIILAQNSSSNEMHQTLQSIFEHAHSMRDHLHLIINQHDDSETNEVISHYMSKYSEQITLLDMHGYSLYEGYKKALTNVQTDYVIFALCGDIIDMHGLRHAYQYFSTHNKKFDVLSFCAQYATQTQADIYPKALRITEGGSVIALKDAPSCIPTSIFGYMFSANAVKNAGFHTELIYDAGLDMVYRLLRDKPYIGYVTGIKYYSAYITEGDASNFPAKMEKSWYFQTFQDFILPTFDYYLTSYSNIPEFLQYATIYQMKWRFRYNSNNGNKHIIDNELSDFLALCHRVLQSISNQVLFNHSLNPKFEMNLTLKFALLYLKEKGTLDPLFIYDRNSILMTQEQVVIYNLANQKIFMDLLDVVDSDLVIEASTDSFIGFENLKLKALLNNEPLEIEETYRYAHTKYFGISTHKRYTFRLTIPIEHLAAHNAISFFLVYNDIELPLKMTATTYNAKIDTRVRSGYWILNNTFMARYQKKNKVLSIDTSSKFEHFKQELRLLKNMFFNKSYRSREMMFFRIVYWITHPFMKKKIIWLTYDKLYKGGDCGEYLYRYMCTRKDYVTPAYVINRDSPDYKRLKKEGYHPLAYGSLKHRLYYVNSSVVFTTHGGVHSFNAFTNKQVSFIEDLLHHDVACIQHGLTVQQLAFNSNRLFNNMKRYYCASKYEIKNLSHPVYGYEDKSILKLTGIPRYDGLVNNDQKQILITPTWRNYIAMPAASKNNAKPYNPDFVKTDYFKLYNELLSDERIVQVAKETGYKIIYLLHPVISAQIDDYPKHEGIEILPALDINYEKILTESSLMVTDYSGVQFDFAYMRKPIVYYHPPKLPPHYKEGGFFYDTMGFGEICTEHNELVDTLCEYMKNHCEVKPFYLARQDDFFAYNDLKSCERIYNDMMDFQNKKIL